LRKRLALGAGLLLLLGMADACWIEPRLLLFRDDVRIPLAAPRTRIAHLSDLHIRGDMGLLHRILREIAAAKPDVIVISGDLIQDVPDPREYEEHAAAVAAFVAGLRRIAPVYGVQGHSEHQGELVARLRRSGLEWLSNEGRRIGPGGGLLLLGLNTQVGLDHLAWRYPSPFRPVEIDGARLYGARRGEPYRNFYSHFDPTPSGLADVGGPLAWSGYEVTCDARIDDEKAGVGLAVHSRYAEGEDRLIEFSRDGSRWSRNGAFAVFSHGSALTGRNDTGVKPEADRWYRLKIRTDVEPARLLVRAKVWPLDRPEPRGWQAVAEDRSSTRVTEGTVGLWASGGGTVVYRNLRVVDHAGRVLLDEPLALPAGAKSPPGFRAGTHMADVVREASQKGIPVVLAGHTHGGQIRLPLFGALTTRSSLGAFYDRGRFEFAAPNDRGLTTLYINPGVGMSVLPVRFWCPPRWALVDLGE
jgi:predicted MPP superfamily phosphohydrolase